MTYKELLNTFIRICGEHDMVNLVGYGNISDINTPDNQEPPEYPYIFINPVNISSNGKTNIVTLNVICMSQDYDNQEGWINTQSNCLSILQDIIAEFNYSVDTYSLLEIQTPVNYTPFKERFSDDVIGVTAQLNIEYDNIFSKCDSPI